ncbi:MAG: PAS domain S-box protein, partial [Desulfobulbaceae bacterium]|nr:PAS domain S-box protein [Desulfobulbaceae bacterium]
MDQVKSKDKQNLLLLLLIMMAACLVVAGSAIAILYRTAFAEEQSRLKENAESQAYLMEAVARFDRLHSQHAHPGGATGATIAQIRDAHEHYDSFGESGEFLIGRLTNDQIHFLFIHQRHTLTALPPVPMASKIAEPMRRALRGETGTMVGPDYRNVTVLAAYHPVRELGLGIVVKIDLAEIRQPFLMASAVVFCVALLTISLGTFLFFRVTTPILKEITRRGNELQAANAELINEITKHRQTAESLRRNEEQTKQLLNSTSEGIFGLDQEGNCTFINQAALTILGYGDHATLLGRNMHQIVHHTTSEGAPFPAADCRILQSFREGKRIHAADEKLWRADGTGFDAEYWAYPVRKKNDTVGAVVTFFDITDRSRAEQALRQSEQKYRRLHESLMDGFVRVAMDGAILECNPTYAAMLGYEEEELLTRTYVDLTPEKWHAMEKRIVEEQILPRGYSEIYEKEYVRRDSTVMPVELRTFLLRDDNGEPEEMWAIVRDISARKAMERELALREARLDAFFTAAPAGMVIFDQECRYLKINETLARRIGLSPEEHYGKHPTDLIPPPLGPQIEGFIKQVAASGNPIVNLENSAPDPLDPSRQGYWVQSFFPIATPAAEAMTIGGIVVEITGRKRAEQRLAASLAEKETL